MIATMVVMATLAQTPGAWQQDKNEHFLMSTGLAVGSYTLLAVPLKEEPLKALLYSSIFTLTVGATWEYASLRGRGGKAEWADFGADCIGAATGALFMYGVHKIIERANAEAER